MGGGEHLNPVNHLETYRVKLRTIGPVFVGSGHKYGKSDYLFDAKNRTVSIVRKDVLMEWLIDNRKVDAYEREFLRPGGQNLEQFLRKVCMFPQDRKKLIRYTIDVGGTLREGTSLKEIDAFIRNSAGQAYIPGSSLKGALRTAILFEKIRAFGRLPGIKNDPKQFPEEPYLHTLGLTRQKEDAINSLMRGISVADSAPIPDTDLTLVQKVDLRKDGQEQRPNLVRECVRPDREVVFSLTLDRSILRDALSARDILKAISDFYTYYRSEFSARFPEEDPDAPASGSCLFLGGGSGFFNKTLIYPYLGYEQALPEVVWHMCKSFPNHHHEKDASAGISPHCMKFGASNGELHEFGLCEVSLT